MTHSLANGGFSATQIRTAREEARRTGRRILDVLEEQTGLTPDTFVYCLAGTVGCPALAMEALSELTPRFDNITYAESVDRDCAVLVSASGEMIFAFSDPFDDHLQAWATERLGGACKSFLVHHGDLAVLLKRGEETVHALDTVRGLEDSGTSSAHAPEDLSLRSIAEDTSEIVRLVRSTLRDALKIGASDIHLETTATGLSIKFRIDGTLSQVKTIPSFAQAEQVISRVKVLSELDITERRIPQDGRFKALDRNREVDFRVSIMPSIFGEDAVVRILDKQALIEQMQALTLDRLGFDAEIVVSIRRLAAEPYGMLLVTGPTGSGKTTTLYAAISEINRGDDKIITIEDPVEYQLPGILQIPVNEKKGLSFAVGLRSILRHDPDKIMVGEIRDAETAAIAVQSALTGHQVFTTVHANNVLDVIGRFMHMQVDLYSFISALNGILAQRLIRLNCANCVSDHHPSPELLNDSGLSAAAVGEFRFRAGSGCGQCRGTGYRGRKAIAELLVLNDRIRELIIARAPARQVKEEALAQGTRFLRDAALECVRRGETTLQEINRVTFVV